MFKYIVFGVMLILAAAYVLPWIVKSGKKTAEAAFEDRSQKIQEQVDALVKAANFTEVKEETVEQETPVNASKENNCEGC